MKVLGVILISIPLALLMVLIFSIPAAWLVMILLGIAHSLEPAIPALGFQLVFVLVLIARLVIPTSNSTTTNK